MIKFFVNGYGNRNGRLELNTHFNQKLSEKWQTGLYVHGNLRSQKFDKNDDGFIRCSISRTDQCNESLAIY